LTAPAVSIVIPTYNRSEKLDRLLRSIADTKSESEFEVIVVDDSERDSVIDGGVRAALGDKLRVIKNPKRSFISRAKNIGWRQAEGEYVFFVDDDNVLPNSTIELLKSKLDSSPHLGALMPVVYYEKRRDLVWVYAAPFAPGRWKFDLIGRNTVERTKPEEELLPTDALPNASMIRRSILVEVGGLDESLPINSSCDLCQRIKRAGFQTCALTAASIYHDVSVPGTMMGYWAEHAAEDSERRYYEVLDWFNLMSRLHGEEQLLILSQFVRAMQFLLPVGVGILIHPTRKKQPLISIYAHMLKGLRDGMRASVSSRRAVVGRG
jgi:GT2 family glycosyltransferase